MPSLAEAEGPAAAEAAMPGLVEAEGASPGRTSVSGALYLLSPSILILWQEGSMTGILDLRQKLQDFRLAGFCQQFRTPQELMAGDRCRAPGGTPDTFSHQIFCDELPGLSQKMK